MKSIETGTPLKEQAPTMAFNDLVHLCTILFKLTSKKSLVDRTLLNNQWLAISDIGNVWYGDLHWQDHFVMIDLTRQKKIASSSPYRFFALHVNGQLIRFMHSHVSSWLTRTMYPKKVLEGLLHRLIDRQDELFARIENLISSGAYTAPISTSHPRATPLQLGRPWTSGSKTVAKMSLQNLVYRYIKEDLYSVAFDTTVRVQHEVTNAITIVVLFADLKSARIRPEEEPFTERQLEAINDKRIAFARLIQNRIVDFIEQHRAREGTRKRSDTDSSSENKARRNRSITGLVTGVMNAWGELDENVRNTVATTRRIVFSHAESGLRKVLCCFLNFRLRNRLFRKKLISANQMCADVRKVHRSTFEPITAVLRNLAVYTLIFDRKFQCVLCRTLDEVKIYSQHVKYMTIIQSDQQQQRDTRCPFALVFVLF